MGSCRVFDGKVTPEAAGEGEKTKMDSPNDSVSRGKFGAEDGLCRSASTAGLSAMKTVHLEDAENLRSTKLPTLGSNTQFTIFYDGRVSVFDGIPPEKIREILQIAAAASNSTEIKNASNGNPAATPSLSRSPSLQSSTAVGSPGARIYPVRQNSVCRLQNDLPIARRQSLQRFLEKRKDRLNNKSPYPTPDMKKADDKAVGRCVDAKSDSKVLGSTDCSVSPAVAYLT